MFHSSLILLVKTLNGTPLFLFTNKFQVNESSVAYMSLAFIYLGRGDI